MKQSRRIVEESGGGPVGRDELLRLAPSDFKVNITDRYAKKNTGIGFV